MSLMRFNPRMTGIYLGMLVVGAHAAVAQAQRTLVWSDEFDGLVGSPPSRSKWGYDVGGGGWGNDELQTYTNSPENVSLDGGGNLVIRAMISAAGGYTSGRIKTLGKLEITYGRIEARIRIPQGQGIWSAFWMLGSDIGTAGWPACGEIDIMENIGREPNLVYGSLHGPGFSGGAAITSAYSSSDGRPFSADFHVYAVEWTPEGIDFLVDAQSYQHVSAASISGSKRWVFNKPFFLLLNLAVGGNWPGRPDQSTRFPQEMLVDYVRVYQTVKPPVINDIGVLNSASFTSVVAPGGVATIFGSGLANIPASDLFDATTGSFPRNSGSTVVSVNGIPAPVIYASPDQINFQAPWETPTRTPVPVQVSHDGLSSNTVLTTFQPTAPAAFSTSGVALLTCIGGAPKAGAWCTLWGNGFGPKNPPVKTGAVSGVADLALATSACGLAIDGVPTQVAFCGAAPGLIIDQLNFMYPDFPEKGNIAVPALLSVGGTSIELRLPGH